jgi:hypothetical protein
MSNLIIAKSVIIKAFLLHPLNYFKILVVNIMILLVQRGSDESDFTHVNETCNAFVTTIQDTF